MTNASKYGILMHSVDNFIQVTVVRDTKEAAMSLLQSVLLGLIQGLTEFLPVSSSGHLAIFKQFFQIETGGMFFDILLHIGTLIAVFIVYYKDIFRMIKEGFAIIGDSFVNVATFFKRVITKEDLPYRKIVHNSYRKFAMLVIVSTIPTGIIGIAAKDLVSAAEQILLVPGICLIITAVLLFIADRIPDGGKTGNLYQCIFNRYQSGNRNHAGLIAVRNHNHSMSFYRNDPQICGKIFFYHVYSGNTWSTGSRD